MSAPAVGRRPRPLRRRLPGPALVAALGFLFLPRPGVAQYLAAYREGLEAVEARDWDAVTRLMEQALSDRSEEKMKLPIRLFLRPYVPHFYLGLARYQLGDCPGAIAAWTESERQGVLPRLPEVEVARRGRERCESAARARDLEEARGEARLRLAHASVPAAALLDRARSDLLQDAWKLGEPSLASRHADGLELLRQARELLADEALGREGVARAADLAREAEAHFAALAEEVDRVEAVRRRELERKDEGIDARVAEARGLLSRTAWLEPYPRQVKRARADLEGLVAEARRRSGDSAERRDGLSSRLEGSITRLEQASAPPPELLEQAARAFLAGRHEQVVALLAAATFDEPRARAHAHLLLAASRHALYLAGGELDSELETAAAEDARECRRAGSGLAPRSRFFSPRFVAFFDAAVAAPSAR